MELNDTEKTTFLTKLATLLGIDKQEDTKLADEPVVPAAEAPETPEEEKTEEDAMAKLTAQVEALQKQVDELLKATSTAVAEKDKAVEEKTALQTELAEIKNKPADKKVALSANPASLSPAEMAWQRYAAK
jgi:arylsulfatase A-like enzyme